MATTRRTTQSLKNNQLLVHQSRGVKRAGDTDLQQGVGKKKRAAFVDLTNNKLAGDNKPVAKKTTVKTNVGGKKKSKVYISVPKTKPTSNSQPDSKAELSWDVIELSQESQSSQESTLSSQSSNTSSDNDSLTTLVDSDLCKSVLSENEKNSTLTKNQTEEPKDWDDIDAENASDLFQVPHYASFIFNYYKEREDKFVIPDYMLGQRDLTAHMRTILVDWLVEVQENFELNHETLYLAIKLVDRYLSVTQVPRERLQLVGATALFIACKFDERCPPVLDDFLYICDDAYRKKEVIKMEMAVLQAIGFDLGIPLSYRFLRRYAKCARADMQTLTLGRYILERSLMDYRFTQQRDSKMAAASLLLALSIKKTSLWNTTLVHYTGYGKEELLPLVYRLNKMISSKPHKSLTTIHSKYSHKVFHEVAKSSPLTEEDLLALGLTSEMMSDVNTSTSSSSSSSDSS